MMKALVIMTSLLIGAVITIKVNSLLNPGFSRDLNPELWDGRLGVKISDNVHISDAGTVDTYGIYPLHKEFAVFTIDKTKLFIFLKQPDIKIYNPSNARSGKERVVDAPASLNFNSTQWNVIDVKHFQVYHFGGQTGDILVDLDAPKVAKVYFWSD